MTPSPLLDAAHQALADSRVALARLDATCCEPGRSPRMRALGTTLDTAEAALGLLGEDSAVDAVLAILEDAGAQIGSLQVGCCAPDRMPLYAAMLEDLMTAQRAVNRAAGRGH